MNTLTIDRDEGLATHMSRVYANVGIGLALSAVTAWLFSSVPALRDLIYSGSGHVLHLTVLGWIALFSPLVLLLVAGLSGMGTWSHASLRTFYMVFTALLGVSLSSVLLVYTKQSVVQAFLVTTIAFCGLSIYGYLTKRDLSGLGSALIMVLWGVIAMGVLAAVTGSHTLNLAVTGVSLLVFAGLTVADTQDAKNRYLANRDDSARIAVWSAMELFLDAVNMFLDILRLTGDSDD